MLVLPARDARTRRAKRKDVSTESVIARMDSANATFAGRVWIVTRSCVQTIATGMELVTMTSRVSVSRDTRVLDVQMHQVASTNVEKVSVFLWRVVVESASVHLVWMDWHAR